MIQGQEAGILVHPTTSLGFVLHQLSRVRIGGGTPLDRGIIVLYRLIQQNRDAFPVIDVCLLTDGRSTSPLDTSEVRASARSISRLSRQITVLNPGIGTDAYLQKLAKLLNATFILRH